MITERGRVPLAPLPRRERHRRQLHAAGHRGAADVPADRRTWPHFRRGSLIVDVSCDEGMGFEWARPTTFDDPMFTVADRVDYYAVDHSPSYLWNSATWENSEALLPFLPDRAGRSGGVGRRRDDQPRHRDPRRPGAATRRSSRSRVGPRSTPTWSAEPARATPRPAARACRRAAAGSVLVPPTTVMKLASPDQRGTTCWCRWSASDPPATPPRFRPDVEGVRAADLLARTRIACWVIAISSAASSAVRSVELGDVAVGQHHQVPGVVGVQVEHGVAVARRARRRRLSSSGSVGDRAERAALGRRPASLGAT